MATGADGEIGLWFVGVVGVGAHFVANLFRWLSGSRVLFVSMVCCGGWEFHIQFPAIYSLTTIIC